MATLVKIFVGAVLFVFCLGAILVMIGNMFSSLFGFRLFGDPNEKD